MRLEGAVKRGQPKRRHVDYLEHNMRLDVEVGVPCKEHHTRTHRKGWQEGKRGREKTWSTGIR